MRYALRFNGPKAIIHFVIDDEARNSICGLSVSLELRYSRRTVAELKDRRICNRCLIVNAARKKAGR